MHIGQQKRCKCFWVWFIAHKFVSWLYVCIVTLHLLLVMFELEYYIPNEGSGPTPSLSDSQRPVILISVVGPHFKVSRWWYFSICRHFLIILIKLICFFIFFTPSYQRDSKCFLVKHEIEDGFSLTLIRRSDVGFDASQIVERNLVLGGMK